MATITEIAGTKQQKKVQANNGKRKNLLGMQDA